jgi:hypothetical protein
VSIKSSLTVGDLSQNGSKSYKNPKIFRVADPAVIAELTAEKFLASARKSL